MNWKVTENENEIVHSLTLEYGFTISVTLFKQAVDNIIWQIESLPFLKKQFTTLDFAKDELINLKIMALELFNHEKLMYILEADKYLPFNPYENITAGDFGEPVDEFISPYDKFKLDYQRIKKSINTDEKKCLKNSSIKNCSNRVH